MDANQLDMQPVEPGRPPIFGQLMRLVTAERQVLLLDPRSIRKIQEFRIIESEVHPDVRANVTYTRPSEPNRVFQIAVRTGYEEIRDRVLPYAQGLEIFTAVKEEDSTEFEEADRFFFATMDQILSIEELNLRVGEEEDAPVFAMTMVQTVAGPLYTFDSVARIEELNQAPSHIEEEAAEEPAPKPTPRRVVKKSPGKSRRK